MERIKTSKTRTRRRRKREIKKKQEAGGRGGGFTGEEKSTMEEGSGQERE